VVDWRYKAHAIDVGSGITGPEAEWYKSSTGAATNAGKLLFDLMNPISQQSWPATPLCNCFGQVYQQNSCNWYIEACFGFNTSSDLENGLPSYQAFIKDTDTNKTVQSPGYFADPKVCVESTITLMFKAEPKCLKPNLNNKHGGSATKQLAGLWGVADKVIGAFTGKNQLKVKPIVMPAFDTQKPN
jgi:hypothetical protein